MVGYPYNFVPLLPHYIMCLVAKLLLWQPGLHLGETDGYLPQLGASIVLSGSMNAGSQRRDVQARCFWALFLKYIVVS